MFEKIISKEIDVECFKEHKFHPVRRWRFDYAIIKYKIAIEVEGAVWTNGRHTRGSGFTKDMEKYNTATSMGRSVLRVTPSTLITKNTIELIKTTINEKNKTIKE